MDIYCDFLKLKKVYRNVNYYRQLNLVISKEQKKCLEN